MRARLRRTGNEQQKWGVLFACGLPESQRSLGKSFPSSPQPQAFTFIQETFNPQIRFDGELKGISFHCQTLTPRRGPFIFFLEYIFTSGPAQGFMHIERKFIRRWLAGWDWMRQARYVLELTSRGPPPLSAE